ncbi:AEC family transporter [Marinactinospora rubrisoli]|uniref:AEC family transporter n=1 Tax=Marinactinospora rubrisoli TaxID=2715399 RepID=A0ABW2KN97_9ACTN
MLGVIAGFSVIASVICVGYILGRTRTLDEHGRRALTRLAFYVATPALLFETLARADLAILTSPSLLVTAFSMLVVAAVFIAVGALRRWGVGRTTVGALCSSYVNSGNLGIPIAVYVLGDATLVAPVMLLQQLVFSPVALTVLDLSQRRPGAPRPSVPSLVTTPFRNPVVLASLAGVLVSASGWHVPPVIMEPVSLIGGMSVPAVLLAFGVSLRGSSLLIRGVDRWPVLLSVLLKTAVHPAVAWLAGRYLFGLDGDLLFVVVTAALPAAQNLHAYASQYEVGTTLARDSILLSTLLSAPAILLVSVLLGGT